MTDGAKFLLCILAGIGGGFGLIWLDLHTFEGAGFVVLFAIWWLFRPVFTRVTEDTP